MLVVERHALCYIEKFLLFVERQVFKFLWVEYIPLGEYLVNKFFIWVEPANKRGESILRNIFFARALEKRFVEIAAEAEIFKIAYLREEELHMTSMEYTLLSVLFRNVGKVLTYNYIIHEVWGSGYGSDTQALRALMAGLRRKIEETPSKPRYLLTEIGVGYRLADIPVQAKA